MSAIPLQNDPTQKIGLNIKGMHCASCVAHVEKALVAVPGVRQARVNLVAQRAEVDSEAGESAETGEVSARLVARRVKGRGGTERESRA